jgi:hypothetical protein
MLKVKNVPIWHVGIHEEDDSFEAGTFTEGVFEKKDDVAIKLSIY